MLTILNKEGWILPGQSIEIIDENDEEYLLECFDGYDGTLKREWTKKNNISEK
jgi:hypothetical protein